MIKGTLMVQGLVNSLVNLFEIRICNVVCGYFFEIPVCIAWDEVLDGLYRSSFGTLYELHADA